MLLDVAGRRRSPATLPGFRAGRPPRNKGLSYPADPPTVEEIVAVMRAAGDGPHGRRLRALIVVLWRAGLRIHEALALSESDLDRRRGSVLVRRGKGGRRREGHQVPVAPVDRGGCLSQLDDAVSVQDSTIKMFGRRAVRRGFSRAHPRQASR